MFAGLAGLGFFLQFCSEWFWQSVNQLIKWSIGKQAIAPE
jgi:hypothetical protein